MVISELMPKIFNGYNNRTSLQNEILFESFYGNEITLEGIVNDVYNNSFRFSFGKGAYWSVLIQFENATKELIIWLKINSENRSVLKDLYRGEPYELEGLISKIKIEHTSILSISIDIELITIKKINSIKPNTLDYLGLKSFYSWGNSFNIYFNLLINKSINFINRFDY